MGKPIWAEPAHDPNVDQDGRVISPVPGVKPGFGFGEHPTPPNRYKNTQNRHTGTDWPGQQGASIVMVGNVSESVAGTVTRVTYDDDYGNNVQVMRDGHVWRFCHLSRVDVREGQKLRANEQIGLVGQTGHVFGPHLHLEKSRGLRWVYNDVLDPTKGW